MLAPDFTLATPEGRSVTLRDYRGKYVLVDFWASWCGPCRAENPNVVRVYQEFKSRHFDVLGISIDDATARAKWLRRCTRITCLGRRCSIRKTRLARQPRNTTCKPFRRISW